MIAEVCGDNRFEIIERAKTHLLNATNIDTSEEEMKVIDSFLFRCWQMGWLDKYDQAETPTNTPTDLIRRSDAVDAIDREIENATPINGDIDSADGHYRYALRLARNLIADLPTADRPRAHILNDGSEIELDEES